jgi:hypothetical protein
MMMRKPSRQKSSSKKGPLSQARPCGSAFPQFTESSILLPKLWVPSAATRGEIPDASVTGLSRDSVLACEPPDFRVSYCLYQRRATTSRGWALLRPATGGCYSLLADQYPEMNGRRRCIHIRIQGQISWRKPADRPTSGSAEQVRNGGQHEDGQGAWAHRGVIATRSRRRSD